MVEIRFVHFKEPSLAVFAHSDNPFPSPEEYLANERVSQVKSEYVNGHIYAMAGSSPEHSAITVNVTVALGSQLIDEPCQAYSSDMKVGTSHSSIFAYPDLSVVCGEPSFHDEQRDVLNNPKVIIEVLSPSTEAFDRGKKFARYQLLESLTDYILIAQDEPRVDHYEKQADDEWLLHIAHGLDAKIHIASINCDLTLAQVYNKVPVTSRGAPHAPLD